MATSLSEEIPMKPEAEGHPSGGGPYTPDDMEGGGDDGDDYITKGVIDTIDDIDDDIDIDDNDDNEMHVTLGCGILGQYPIISLISFVIGGICLGVGLSFWRPTDEDELNTKAVTLQWLGLIGDLFLRYVVRVRVRVRVRVQYSTVLYCTIFLFVVTLCVCVFICRCRCRCRLKL
jgi:hypothetical protein